jgi:site-specific DNA-methyltransferase (adenine-specific)
VKWDGWGTALKPAFEPIVVARKPLTGTVAANVLEHGTGALNINACRIEAHDEQLAAKYASVQNAGSRANSIYGADDRDRAGAAPHTAGRWPTNVVLDHTQATELDKQSGIQRDGVAVNRNRGEERPMTVAGVPSRVLHEDQGYGGSGGASRFFPVFDNRKDTQPCSGATTEDSTNDATCADSPSKSTTQLTHDNGESTTTPSTKTTASDLPTFKYEPKAPTLERPRDDQVAHPTVKPLDLMAWLIRLVTPPGGLVLDPFAGSGTTAEACIIEHYKCITIEREATYLPLIVARLTKPIQVGLDFGGDVA